MRARTFSILASAFTLAGAFTLVGAAAHGDERTPDAFCELTPCLTGPFDRRKLIHDEIFGRVACQAGTEVGFDLQRRLAFCTTARAVVLDGVPVAAGAYTLFHPNGRLYETHLAKARAFVIAGGRKVSCAAQLVALNDDGQLRACALSTAFRGAIAARANTFISFHPDGRIASATLDRPVTVAGIRFAAGTRLDWDVAGAVTGGSLATPGRVAGLPIRSDFALYPDGKLKFVDLEEPTRVQGHDFPVGAELQFRADGTLERALYVAASGFMIHGEAWRDTASVTYDRSGAETSRSVHRWQSEVRHDPVPRIR